MNSANYNVLTPKKSNSVNELLDELFQDRFSGHANRFSPSVDIFEDDQLYGIFLSLPGIKKEEIKIDIADNRLQVSGQRVVNGNGIIFHVQEIPKGTFSKVFHIPKDVQQDKIEAKYEEGLLKLTLPKNQKLKHKYRIDIK